MSANTTIYSKFIESRQAACRSQQTISYYQQVFRQIERFLNGRELSQDTAIEFLNDCRDRGLSKASVASYARAIRALARFHEYSWKIPSPRLDRPNPSTLAPEQVETALRKCRSERDRAILLTLLETGIRRGELLSMSWEYIDLDNGRMEIVGKTGPREVLLTPRVIDALNRLRCNKGWVWVTRSGDRLTKAGLRMMLDRLGSRAGIHLNPHKFRRTCATRLAEVGSGPVLLQSLMGWSSIQMAQYYCKPSEESARKFQGLAFG